MTQEPLVDLGRLVGAVVVADEVQFHRGGHRFVD